MPVILILNTQNTNYLQCSFHITSDHGTQYLCTVAVYPLVLQTVGVLLTDHGVGLPLFSHRLHIKALYNLTYLQIDV